MVRVRGGRTWRAAMLMMIAVVASATAEPQTLVLESYIGERPREADRILAPLRAALQKKGFVVAPAEVADRLRGFRTLPVEIERVAPTTEELTAALERAGGDWLDGRLERAAVRLEAAIALAYRFPHLLALEFKTRDLVFSSLLSLAQARNRQGQREASLAAMAELIRSYPDQRITRGQHGPEAFELYTSVRRSLDSEGRGALIVTMNVPAVVFVDEVPRSLNGDSARITDLVPGEYRVLIQPAAEPTAFRLFRVAVYSKQVTRLRIDWGIDSVLVAGTWVGFRFAAPLRYPDESEVAFRLSKSISVSSLVVLSVGNDQKSRLIEASFYDLASRSKRCGGRIRLSGRGTDKAYMNSLVDQLQRCLASRTAIRADASKPQPAAPPRALRSPPALGRSSRVKGTFVP